MESDARAQLAIVERAAAAPYVRFPPTPWWYPPVLGLWVAAMIGTFAWWRSDAVLFAASLAILLGLEAVFVRWLQRRHGALPVPGRGTPPAEIRRVWRGYFLGLPVVAGLIALAWLAGGVAAAAGTAFVAVTGAIAVYERRYAAAAAAVRERLR